MRPGEVAEGGARQFLTGDSLALVASSRHVFPEESLSIGGGWRGAMRAARVNPSRFPVLALIACLLATTLVAPPAAALPPLATAVSVGFYHTCALLNNGNIQCWGDNDDGQAASYSGGSAIAVSAGYAHTCDS